MMNASDDDAVGCNENPVSQRKKQPEIGNFVSDNLPTVAGESASATKQIINY